MKRTLLASILIIASTIVAASALASTPAKTKRLTHMNPDFGVLGFSGSPFGPHFYGASPLPAVTPVNRNNRTYVRKILAALRNGPPVSREGFLGIKGSPNLYIVPANQPYVPVYTYNPITGERYTRNPYINALNAGGIPIPTSAVASGDSDATMHIYQPSTDRLWELWKVKRDANGNWTDSGGGRIEHVSQSNGIMPQHYGTAATGLSVLGMQARVEELQAGQVDHPIQIAFPHAITLAPGVIPANSPGASRSFSWPAWEDDGTCTAANCIPEGLRFRLDPKLNLSKFHLTPVAHTIAVAAQRYGFIVGNSGPDDVNIGLGNSYLYTAHGQADPYHALFGANYGAGYSERVMANFPWSHLQALPFNYGAPADTTPPSIDIRSPRDTTTVSGGLPITLDATDNTSVSSVQVMLDGNALGGALTSSIPGFPKVYRTTWNTTAASNGAHILSAIATDASGNTAWAGAVTVTVANP